MWPWFRDTGHGKALLTKQPQQPCLGFPYSTHTRVAHWGTGRLPISPGREERACTHTQAWTPRTLGTRLLSREAGFPEPCRAVSWKGPAKHCRKALPCWVSESGRDLKNRKTTTEALAHKLAWDPAQLDAR